MVFAPDKYAISPYVATMSTNTPSDINLSPKALRAISDILREQRSAFKDDMERVMAKMGGTTGGSMGGFGGFFGGGGDLKKMKVEIESLTQIFKNNSKSLSAYEQYMRNSAKRQMKTIDEMIAAEEAAKKAQEDNTDSVEENTDAQEKNSGAIRRTVENTKDFARSLVEGNIAIKGFNKAVDEIRTSYKLGFNWNPLTDAIQGIKMGMDPKEMMEFQATFRRTSNAMNGGIDEFNKMVADNQSQMIQYTGSMKAAAQAMGNMYEISNSMGLDLEDVGKSANDLFSQFKRMNAATSMTIDQFTDLTKSLVDDQDIRTKLLGLQEKQRGTYIQSLLKQQDLLMAQGMTFEAAQKLVKYVEGATNKSPFERLKQSMQFVQYAKLIGMNGKDAERMSRLMRQRNLNEDERSEYTKLMTDYTKRKETYRNSAGPKIAGNMQWGEFLVDKLDQITGINTDAFGEAAAQQSAQRNPVALAKHQVDLAQRQEDWLQKIFKQSVIITDQLQAWGSSAIGVVTAAAVAAMLSGKGLGMLGLGGRAAGAAGGAAGGWKSVLAGAPGRMGAGAGIAALGFAGASLIDPSSAETKYGRNNAEMGKSAMQYGSLGMGAGFALGGPLGALGGAAIGGITGAIMSMVEQSKNFERQANDLMDMNNTLVSANKMRLTAERDTAADQLKLAEKQLKLTGENSKTVDELRARVESLNKSIALEDTRGSILNAANFKGTAGILMKGSLDDTGDLRKMAASLDSASGLGGDANSLQTWLSLANRKANESGISDTQRADFARLYSSLQDPTAMSSIPSSLKPFFEQTKDQVISDMDTRVQEKLGGQIAELKDKSPEALSSIVQANSADAVRADTQIAQLEKKLDDMRKNPPLFDESGMGTYAEAAQIEEQLKALRESRDGTVRSANVLEQFASGSMCMPIKANDDFFQSMTKAVSDGLKGKSQQSFAANFGHN